ncbi:alpha/beta fold hydrolase [Pseudoduganella sp. OTU4001]|uniref:alpha/beta fold hydrolase n=1 Tax=Pseudoduganella sp. OTU4001 TaxID=3043854 RepID=UPI00313EBE41
MRIGRLAGLALAAALAACATPAERFERRAAALGFASMQLQGQGFEHRAYAAQAGRAGGTLHVYVEHDGTPWSSIDRVAADPTPRTAYALELMAKDSGPRLFLGRPCYFQLQTAPECGPLQWTHERYSPQVVGSMVAALRRYLAAQPHRHVVLVGYSGGGTLAWLMAAQMPEATGVVTIAANLDIDSWTRLHGYSALAGSLNPATAPALPPGVAQRHYAGGRDANVPPAVLRSFALRHPRASVVEIAEFDHTCCWLERWPGLLPAEK